MAKVFEVCISDKKGTSKLPVDSAYLRANFGMVGDAHAGTGCEGREISLLAIESIERLNRQGFDFKAGDFAENITTQGLVLVSIPVGTKIKIGNDIVLQVTQVGKKCHTGCAVFELAGKCIMPKEGIFARVMCGGTIRRGDEITLV